MWKESAMKCKQNTYHPLPPTTHRLPNTVERLYAGTGPAAPPLCLAIWVIGSRPL